MEQNKISYNFTPVPTQLMLLCDVNVRSALFTMVELSKMFADENGIFFRTNNDLQDDMKLSKNLVVATIDALYQKGLIDVFVSENHRQGKKTPSNKYRVKFDEFKRFETLSFNDLKNPDNFIETANYYVKGYKPSYLSNTSSTTSPNTSSKIDDNIETIDTKETTKNVNSEEFKKENLNQEYNQGIEQNVTSTSKNIITSTPVELDKSIPTHKEGIPARLSKLEARFDTLTNDELSQTLEELTSDLIKVYGHQNNFPVHINKSINRINRMIKQKSLVVI